MGIELNGYVIIGCTVVACCRGLLVARLLRGAFLRTCTRRFYRFQTFMSQGHTSPHHALLLVVLLLRVEFIVDSRLKLLRELLPVPFALGLLWHLKIRKRGHLFI